MWPDRESVLLTLVRTLARGAWKRKFAALLDRVRVPPPVRVTSPFIFRNVLLPPEFSCMALLLVMVPWSVVVVLFGVTSVPVLVTPLSVAVLLVWIIPPELVVSVPPLICTEFSTLRSEERRVGKV